MPSVRFLLCALGAFLVFGAIAFLAHALALLRPAWRGFAGFVLVRRARQAKRREAMDPVVVRSRILPDSKPFFKAKGLL